MDSKDKIIAEEQKPIYVNQDGEKSMGVGYASNLTVNNYHAPQSNTERPEDLRAELEKYRSKIALYETLGITDCTERLKGTGLEPIKCMGRVKHSLYFMGVGGEKWVKDDQLVDAFSNMLRRTRSAVNGGVRFLLIDPSSDAYKDLYELRRDSVPYKSYPKFVDLVKKFKNLEVRLYNTLPSFRMQFVDETYLAVSRYYFDKADHDNSSGGWEIPHLIIQNEKHDYKNETVSYKGSLYYSFQHAYDHIWNQSRDILDWDKDDQKYIGNCETRYARSQS